MKKQIEYPRLLIKDRHETKEDFFVRRKKLYNYDLHWHDCFEIELILSGTATHELNGTTYRLSQGDIYLLNPTDFHSVQSDGAEIYSILFSENLIDEGMLQQVLSIEKNIAFKLDRGEFETATNLISQMLVEFKAEKEYSSSYIKNLLECLFILLLRKCNFDPEPDTDENTMNIRKSLLYIHSHFRDNPTLETVAKISGFNKNYFSSLFHKTTGHTYKNYLNLLKLEHAKKLILSGGISITEICYASGFSSLPNFLRSFKAHFGISPGEMRRSHSRTLAE